MEFELSESVCKAYKSTFLKAFYIF